MWYLIKVVIFIKRNGSIHDKDTVITIFNIDSNNLKIISSRENEFLFISVSTIDAMISFWKKCSSWLQFFWKRILYLLNFVFSARNLFSYHSTFREVKSSIIYLLQRSLPCLMPYVLASYACNVQVLKCKQSLFEVVFELFNIFIFLNVNLSPAT